MVIIKEALDKAYSVLKDSSVENPKLDARLLMEQALNISREDLILCKDKEISVSDYNVFLSMIERRANREPVSRILGYRDFWKSRFEISSETLDPRPDTETLIEQVVKYCSQENIDSILDLGTGSGCILLSLLQEFKDVKGVGVDISSDAINTSVKNANKLGLADRANFINISWNSLVPDSKFNVVVSNPPYIKESEINALEGEVKGFDPIKALSGGDSGLDCYKEIITLLPNFLQKNGWVFLEIGYNQKYDVEKMLTLGGFTVIDTVKDLGGCDRCIIARWN